MTAESLSQQCNRRRRLQAVTVSVLTAAVGGASLLAAEGPLVLKRELRVNLGTDFHPTHSDYNGDGIDDLMLRVVDAVELRSGLDGKLLAVYTGEPNPQQSFGWAMESIPDADGDGLRDFLVGSPTMLVNGREWGGVVYGVKSSVLGGKVNGALLYRVEGTVERGAFGLYLGSTSRLGIVSAPDQHKVVLIDAATGATRAFLDGPTNQFGVAINFGDSTAGIGDLNGDGVEDVVIGGEQAFLLDGTVTTSAWTRVSSSSLGEKRLAVLAPIRFHPGMHGGRGDRELFANLGDPLPSNGVRDQLIVSSGLNDENRPGGFAAHLVTERSGGGFGVREVAVSLQGLFVQDVVALPDVDGDGVRDVALLEPDFADGDGDQIGRVRVLSGAELLDGFSVEDVIQEVYGAKRRFFYRGMRALGDQDRDGLEELLVSGLDAREGYTFVRIYSVVPASGSRPDCNANGVPDDLDLKGGELAFAPGEVHGVGDFPREAVVADLNGDARQDIAVATYRSKEVSILLNEGGGGLSAAERFPVENGPWSVAAGDLDRDGDLDLATANLGTDIPSVGIDFGTTVSLLLNDGRGVFRSGGDLEVSPGPTSVRAGDFNSDGAPDLVVGSLLPSGVLSILLNDGAGRFGPPHNSPDDSGPAAVHLADFNRDGALDIAFVSPAMSRLTIVQNNRRGGFGRVARVEVGFSPEDLTGGDFDGDRHTDLALSDDNLFGIMIVRGSEEWGFSGPDRFQAGAREPRGIAAADFDGDGDLDLATASEGREGLWMFMNSGGGTFNDIRRFAAGESFQSIAAGDLDGQGGPDIVLLDSNADRVVVRLNQTTPPASQDCNRNAVPDECDVKETGADKNGNGVLDACEPSPAFSRGDANADGALDVTDGLCVLRFLFEGAFRLPDCLEAADTNNDGVLDCSDAIFILGYLFLGTAVPPPPGPPPQPCGSDPDPPGSRGDLGCGAYDACPGSPGA